MLQQNIGATGPAGPETQKRPPMWKTPSVLPRTRDPSRSCALDKRPRYLRLPFLPPDFFADFFAVFFAAAFFGEAFFAEDVFLAPPPLFALRLLPPTWRATRSTTMSLLPSRFT